MGYMNFLFLICVGVSAFTAGFVLGFISGGRGKGKICTAFTKGAEEARINREYRNFLTYDGTVQ